MQQAVLETVFPGGALLVSKDRSVVFHDVFGKADSATGEPIEKKTVFDLASLTKPLATTPAVMKLVQDGRMDLEDRLGSLIPEFHKTDKESIRISQLLAHTSGLIDYIPYFKSVKGLSPGERKPALRRELLSAPVLNPPGRAVLYSDIGFMILEWIVERISGSRMDRFLYESVYAPLNVDYRKGLFFVDLEADADKGVKFAATEDCPWRKKIIKGEVHDENTYLVGGIQGHAGLFGEAESIHDLLAGLLSMYYGDVAAPLFSKEIMQTFFKRQGNSGRALGFDMPSAEGSSAGKYFSDKSIGHLGFTGTSFWIDPEKAVIVVLLTNRIHPSRDNIKIKAFRPALHDRIMETLVALEM